MENMQKKIVLLLKMLVQKKIDLTLKNNIWTHRNIFSSNPSLPQKIYIYLIPNPKLNFGPLPPTFFGGHLKKNPTYGRQSIAL